MLKIFVFIYLIDGIFLLKSFSFNLASHENIMNKIYAMEMFHFLAVVVGQNCWNHFGKMAFNCSMILMTFKMCAAICVI